MISVIEAVIFSACDPFHIYYKALMTPQKCTVVKLFFEVFQLTSALEYTSVCPMEIHDMETAGNIANLTVAYKVYTRARY